ncbi:hypothetical protein B296_00043706 [Ensete ventricosum]|uniref:AB hydrolase-1 domain-containing protein n=1 Tax=Ensete ventricosum TaxID=4639 RepID=A0A426XBY3_ENSVE|nr:hypothetical protein B296_00043706 [Ensete ventricosum]
MRRSSSRLPAVNVTPNLRDLFPPRSFLSSGRGQRKPTTTSGGLSSPATGPPNMRRASSSGSAFVALLLLHFLFGRVRCSHEYSLGRSSSPATDGLCALLIRPSGYPSAFTMPDMVEMIESAALLCPISYLDHITSSFVLRAVFMRLDQGKIVASTYPTDVQHTLEELKSKPELLYIDNYGHIDFILSVKAKDDVYADLIRFLKSRGCSSSY